MPLTGFSLSRGGGLLVIASSHYGVATATLYYVRPPSVQTLILQLFTSDEKTNFYKPEWLNNSERKCIADCVTINQSSLCVTDILHMTVTRGFESHSRRQTRGVKPKVYRSETQTNTQLMVKTQVTSSENMGSSESESEQTSYKQWR